ncbi:hypothetical protein BGZ82_002894, partial [Podila clonocystis]
NGISDKAVDLINKFVKAVKGVNNLVVLGTADEIKGCLSFGNAFPYKFPNLTDSSYTEVATAALGALPIGSEELELVRALYDDNVPS